MKTEEELKTLKEEVEAVNKKSAELTDEELTQVAAGAVPTYTERQQDLIAERTQVVATGAFPMLFYH